MLGVTASPRTRDIVMALLVIVMAAGAVAYIAAGPATGSSINASTPLAGAETGTLAVTGGAATTHLHVGNTGEDLYHATIQTSFGAQPQVTNATGKVTIDFGATSSGLFSIHRVADVTLSDQVPWTISIDGGAMSLDGDLSEGKLTSLNLSGGASRIDLRLPAPLGDAPVHLSGGALDVRLHRPAGSAMRITINGGASTIYGDGRQVASLSGDATWETPDWGSSPDRYTVTVDGGANTVRSDTG